MHEGERADKATLASAAAAVLSHSHRLVHSSAVRAARRGEELAPAVQTLHLHLQARARRHMQIRCTRAADRPACDDMAQGAHARSTDGSWLWHDSSPVGGRRQAVGASVDPAASARRLTKGHAS